MHGARNRPRGYISTQRQQDQLLKQRQHIECLAKEKNLSHPNQRPVKRYEAGFNQDQIRTVHDVNNETEVMQHALEKAEVWDRMGLPQEACKVMQKMIYAAPWMEEPREAQRKFVDNFNAGLYDEKKQRDKADAIIAWKGKEEPLLGDVGMIQEKRLLARGRRGGGPVGGVGEYHRQRGAGLAHPVDLPVHRKHLDAELFLKRQKEEKAAAEEAALQCLYDKWGREDMRRQAYSELKQKPNDILGLRAIEEEQNRRAQRLPIAVQPASGHSIGRGSRSGSFIQAQSDRATLPFCWQDGDDATQMEGRRQPNSRTVRARSVPFQEHDEAIPPGKSHLAKHVQDNCKRHADRMQQDPNYKVKGHAWKNDQSSNNHREYDSSRSGAQASTAALRNRSRIRAKQQAHADRLNAARQGVQKSSWAAPDYSIGQPRLQHLVERY